MKRIAPLLLLCWVAAAQPNPPSVETMGSCSPVTTGNGNTLNLTCTGLTPAQQRLLQSLPALVNKLLASQADNTSEILSKLDTCIAQGLPRHVTKEEADFWVAALVPFRGQNIRIQIYTMVKEANDFGREVSAALKHAGL